MPKKRAATTVRPQNDSSWSRRLIESPSAELEKTLADLERWVTIMSKPEVAAEFERSAGWRAVTEMALADGKPPPSAKECFEFSMRRRIDRLESGKREAAALHALTADGAIGGLRAYLYEHPASAEAVVWLLAENRRLSIALAASRAAKSKNQPARDWVASEWRNRADKGQSKASFARMLAPLVKKKFGVSVTPDRIARYWVTDE
jgi:hypothetical protein